MRVTQFTVRRPCPLSLGTMIYHVGGDSRHLRRTHRRWRGHSRQVTTAIATARRDRSRLDWEKQQQNREWDVREEECFLAIKQEQYARFGAAVGDFLEYMDPWLRWNYHIAPPREQPDLEPLSLIMASIDLVAPEGSLAAGVAVHQRHHELHPIDKRRGRDP